MSQGSHSKAEDTHTDGCTDTAGGRQAVRLGDGHKGDAFPSHGPVLGGNNPETSGDIPQPS